VLVLACNRFAAPPLGLSLVDSLRVLDLSSNGLDSLPSLNRLRRLEQLRVHDNTLRTFPVLDSLANLRVLSAARCSLVTVHPGVGRLSKLDSLDLSGNQLVDLPLEVTWLTGPVSVSVAGNQLCTLQVAIENWLDLKAGPTWESDQVCP
jgi:Leucine-rich repeat (LRR) protein